MPPHFKNKQTKKNKIKINFVAENQAAQGFFSCTYFATASFKQTWTVLMHPHPTIHGLKPGKMILSVPAGLSPVSCPVPVGHENRGPPLLWEEESWGLVPSASVSQRASRVLENDAARVLSSPPPRTHLPPVLPLPNFRKERAVEGPHPWRSAPAAPQTHSGSF